MGEVYRAADIKLGREVAIKVLPLEKAHEKAIVHRDRAGDLMVLPFDLARLRVTGVPFLVFHGVATDGPLNLFWRQADGSE